MSVCPQIDEDDEEEGDSDDDDPPPALQLAAAGPAKGITFAEKPTKGARQAAAEGPASGGSAAVAAAVGGRAASLMARLRAGARVVGLLAVGGKGKDGDRKAATGGKRFIREFTLMLKKTIAAFLLPACLPFQHTL